MNNELKVSFYFKREGSTERTEVNPDAVYPIVGKIIIGNSIAQFSSKLKIEERLWSVKSGRAIGKSRVAVELNREINKINLSIHAHYRDILERTGTVIAQDVKNAFQGIATAQKTLLVLFGEMMQNFQTRIGIDRAESTYHKYITIRKQVKRFLKVKYNVQDIPLNQLDLPFVEAFDYHLRVERKMTDESVSSTMLVLFKVVRIALNRKLIVHPPFFGFKLKKPDFKIRSITKDELQRLISTPLESKSLCFIRDMFVFAAFTGLPYVDLKQLTWKEIITEEDGSLWISTDRQKTGIPFHVKLLDIPMQIIEKYRGLGEKRKSIGVRISATTFPVYINAYRHLKEFLLERYNLSDLPFGKIDTPFVESYFHYLKIDLKMTARTVKTNMNPFRQAVVRAYNKGVLRQNPFFDFVPERVIPKRPWLSNDEIQRIIQAKLKLATWRFTRDMFIFSTFTGIAIIDLRNLKHTNIREMEDGSLWIILDRQKTGMTSYIPLLDIPKQILERYSNSDFAGTDGKVFKLQTHVNMNWQLKRIAKAAEIDKRLTFHMSRFSFASTVCLTQDVSIEGLSQMMGHLSIKTTQIYAEVTRTKINEDMTNLSDKIQGKYEFSDVVPTKKRVKKTIFKAV